MKNLLIYSVLIIAFGVIALSGIIRYLEKLANEHSYITTESSLNCCIKKIFVGNGLCVVTCDSMKIRLDEIRIHDDTDYILSEELSVGDSLVKHSGSDTIFVFNEKGRHYFIQKQ